MTEVDLLADIGGTNARVAFRENGLIQDHVYLRRTENFPSLESLLNDVLAEARCKPVRAALAVAGPVSGDVVKLTNLPWEFSQTALGKQMGVRDIRVLNDLEAIAYALPHLGPQDVATWSAGKADGAAQVVVAAGTGLGVAGLIQPVGGMHAIPSEGGHALAPMPHTTPDAFKGLWQDAAPAWEDLTSGAGLLRLYRVLGPASPTMTPADVTALALEGDARARDAVGFFATLLGACAGDMTMIFAARGGCYIAGGVVPALGAMFDVKRFLTAFMDKGAYAGYLKDVPTFLIRRAHPALLGLAAQLGDRV